MRKVEVIPAIIMALGTVTKHFEKWLDKLDLDQTSEALHKLCLLGTTRIIRKVLDMKSEKKRKKKLQYLRKLFRVCYCAIFYLEITSDLRGKEIIIIIVIINHNSYMKTKTITVIVGAPGMIKRETQKYVHKIPGNLSPTEIQEKMLKSTAQIFRTTFSL